MVRSALSESLPPQSPRISSRASTGRRRRRIRLELDDGTTLDLSPTVLDQFPLYEGDAVDAALQAQLLDADLRHRCRETALSLLDVRARSRTELARRLRDKEFPAGVIRDLLDDFEERGWLDDAAFARALARDRIRFKPRAPVRLHQELQRRGVDSDVADEQIQRVMREEETSPDQLARTAAEAWLRRQGHSVQQALARTEWHETTEKAKRRLLNHLARRGFRGSPAIAALDAARALARQWVAERPDP